MGKGIVRADVRLRELLNAISRTDELDIVSEGLRQLAEDFDKDDEKIRTSTDDALQHRSQALSYVYILGSPRAQELFAVWDLLKHLDGSTTKIAVHLLNCFAGLLRCLSLFTNADIANADVVSTTISRTHLKLLYRCLAAADIDAQFATVRLMESMVSLSPTSARELFRNFNFNYKAFRRLAAYQVSDAVRSTGKPRVAPVVRDAFLSFTIASLKSLDAELVETVLNVRGFVKPIFGGLAYDQYELQKDLLQRMFENVLSSKSVNRRLKTRFFDSRLLGQLCSLYECGKDESLSDGETYQKDPRSGVLVHEFLKRACTDGSFGLVDSRPSVQFQATTGGISLTRNRELLKFLVDMVRPAESTSQLELLRAILTAVPSLLPLYLRSVKFVLAPRASDAWTRNVGALISACAFVGESVDSVPVIRLIIDPIMSSIVRVEGSSAGLSRTSIEELCDYIAQMLVPPVLSRATVRQCLTYTESAVVPQLMLRLLSVIASNCKRVLSWLKMRKSFSNAAMAASFDGLASGLRDKLKQLLPDVQTLLFVRQQLVTTIEDGGDASGVKEAKVSYAHLLGALGSYLHFIDDCNIDAAKVLPFKAPAANCSYLLSASVSEQQCLLESLLEVLRARTAASMSDWMWLLPSGSEKESDDCVLAALVQLGGQDSSCDDSSPDGCGRVATLAVRVMALFLSAIHWEKRGVQKASDEVMDEAEEGEDNGGATRGNGEQSSNVSHSNSRIGMICAKLVCTMVRANTRDVLVTTLAQCYVTRERVSTVDNSSSSNLATTTPLLRALAKSSLSADSLVSSTYSKVSLWVLAVHVAGQSGHLGDLASIWRSLIGPEDAVSPFSYVCGLLLQSECQDASLGELLRSIQTHCRRDIGTLPSHLPSELDDHIVSLIASFGSKGDSTAVVSRLLSADGSLLGSLFLILSLIAPVSMLDAMRQSSDISVASIVLKRLDAVGLLSRSQIARLLSALLAVSSSDVCKTTSEVLGPFSRDSVLDSFVWLQRLLDASTVSQSHEEEWAIILRECILHICKWFSESEMSNNHKKRFFQMLATRDLFSSQKGSRDALRQSVLFQTAPAILDVVAGWKDHNGSILQTFVVRAVAETLEHSSSFDSTTVAVLSSVRSLISNEDRCSILCGMNRRLIAYRKVDCIPSMNEFSLLESAAAVFSALSLCGESMELGNRQMISMVGEFVSTMVVVLSRLSQETMVQEEQERLCTLWSNVLEFLVLMQVSDCAFAEGEVAELFAYEAIRADDVRVCKAMVIGQLVMLQPSLVVHYSDDVERMVSSVSADNAGTYVALLSALVAFAPLGQSASETSAGINGVDDVHMLSALSEKCMNILSAWIENVLKGQAKPKLDDLIGGMSIPIASLRSYMRLSLESLFVSLCRSGHSSVLERLLGIIRSRTQISEMEAQFIGALIPSLPADMMERFGNDLVYRILASYVVELTSFTGRSAGGTDAANFSQRGFFSLNALHMAIEHAGETVGNLLCTQPKILLKTLRATFASPASVSSAVFGVATKLLTLFRKAAPNGADILREAYVDFFSSVLIVRLLWEERENAQETLSSNDELDRGNSFTSIGVTSGSVFGMWVQSLTGVYADRFDVDASLKYTDAALMTSKHRVSVLSLLLVVVDALPDVTLAKLSSDRPLDALVVLGAYNARESCPVDAMAYSVLARMDECAKVLSRHRYIFGAAVRAHVRTILPLLQSGSKAMGSVSRLWDSTWNALNSQIDSDALRQSSWPRKAYTELLHSGGEAQGSSPTTSWSYQAEFLVSAVMHVIEYEEYDVREFIDTGFLSFAVRMLSSPFEELRKKAYHIVGSVFTLLDGETLVLREREQCMWILRSLRGSVTEAWQRLPGVVTAFVAEALFVLLRPDHCCYPLINKFLLQRPSLDVTDVPMFYELFNSSTDMYKIERVWMLRVLARGFVSPHDLLLLRRRRCLQLLMAFMDSTFADSVCHNLVLSVLEGGTASAHTCGRYLVTEAGALLWLTGLLRPVPVEEETDVGVMSSGGETARPSRVRLAGDSNLRVLRLLERLVRLPGVVDVDFSMVADAVLAFASHTVAAARNSRRIRRPVRDVDVQCIRQCTAVLGVLVASSEAVALSLIQRLSSLRALVEWVLQDKVPAADSASPVGLYAQVAACLLYVHVVNYGVRRGHLAKNSLLQMEEVLYSFRLLAGVSSAVKRQQCSLSHPTAHNDAGSGHVWSVWQKLAGGIAGDLGSATAESGGVMRWQLLIGCATSSLCTSLSNAVRKHNLQPDDASACTESLPVALRLLMNARSLDMVLCAPLLVSLHQWCMVICIWSYGASGLQLARKESARLDLLLRAGNNGPSPGLISALSEEQWKRLQEVHSAVSPVKESATAATPVKKTPSKRKAEKRSPKPESEKKKNKTKKSA